MGSVVESPQNRELSGEQQHADHVEALASDAVAGPGGDRQHNRIRNQVTGQDPGGFILPGGKRSGNVGERHVRN